jgi:hypothetical protein
MVNIPFDSSKSPEDHPGYRRIGKPYKMNQEHWEMKYEPDPAKNRKNQIMGGDFDPMNTKDRYRVYNPVNETDT